MERIPRNIITISVPIARELANVLKTFTYKIKFADSIRLMVSSPSNCADNLAEGLHKDKYIDCKSYLKYVNAKDGLLLFNCSDCNNNYEKLNEDLAKRFVNAYLVNHDLSKWML